MKELFKTLPLLAFCAIAYIPNLSNATIVYVADKGFELSDTEGESMSFAFGEVSQMLTFRTWLESEDQLWWTWGSPGARVQGIWDPDFSAARLEAGIEISGDVSWEDRIASYLASTSGEGSFYDSLGFVGVRVYEEFAGWLDPNALPYYGWIRVEHSASAGTLTVYDWAWNSVPGEPILAGAIPEPRVYALSFGVAALAFVVARRLRRKQV